MKLKGHYTLYENTMNMVFMHKAFYVGTELDIFHEYVMDAINKTSRDLRK